MKSLQTTYATDAVILGVSIDANLARTDRTIKEKGMTYLSLADGRGFDGPIPQAYHVDGTPTIYVLDRAGRIFAKLGSAKQIEARLQDALAKPPQP